MTVTTSETVKYNVLVAYDDVGAIRGGHLIRRRRVFEDGALISDALLPAEPLAEHDIAELMTQAQAETIAQLDVMQADCDALQGEYDQFRAAAANQVAALQDQVQGLGEDLAAEQAKAIAAEAAYRVEVERLQQDLAAARQELATALVPVA